MKIHPVADMFPRMPEGRDWNNFVQDIHENGQADPIVMDGDVLLDGRNRAAACKALGIEPKVIQWSSLGLTCSPDEWIIAKNLFRRDLTPDQRTAIRAEYDLWALRQANEQMKRGAQFPKGNAGGPGRGKKTVQQKSGAPFTNRNQTRKELAEAAGVSTYVAEQAIKLTTAVENGTVPKSVAEDVKKGKVKLKDAVKAIARSNPKKKKEKPLRDRVCAHLNKLFSKFNDDELEEVKSIIREQVL